MSSPAPHAPTPKPVGSAGVPPTEAELLELIEGVLSPAREREVRAAAAADPELAGQILRMMQHRSMLRQLDESLEARAPSDLAEQAVVRARAEHMETMQRQSAGASGGAAGRHGSRRALAVAATVAVCTLGGWIWFMVSRVGPGGTATTITPYSTPLIDVDRSGEKDIVARGPEVPPPEEDAYGNEIERVLADSLTVTESMRPTFVGPPVLASEAAVRATIASDGTLSGGPSQADALLNEWIANLGGLDQGVAISPERAAELALAGKLRIIVRAEGSGANKRKVIASAESNGGGPLSGMDADILAAGPKGLSLQGVAPASPVRPSPDADRTIVLVVKKASSRAELAGLLASLLERIGNAASAEATFDEAVPNEDPLAGLETSDLLWWTKPSEQWDRGAVLRVPVVFAGGRAEPRTP